MTWAWQPIPAAVQEEAPAEPVPRYPAINFQDPGVFAKADEFRWRPVWDWPFRSYPVFGFQAPGLL